MFLNPLAGPELMVFAVAALRVVEAPAFFSRRGNLNTQVGILGLSLNVIS
jgi:hypothetical protein